MYPVAAHGCLPGHFKPVPGGNKALFLVLVMRWRNYATHDRTVGSILPEIVSRKFKEPEVHYGWRIEGSAGKQDNPLTLCGRHLKDIK